MTCNRKTEADSPNLDPIEDFENALRYISYSDATSLIDFSGFLREWRSEAFSTLRDEFRDRINHINLSSKDIAAK